MCGRFYVSEAELDDFAALIEGIEKDLLKPRPNRNGSGDIMPGDFAPILIADPENPARRTTVGLPVLHDPKPGLPALHISAAGLPVLSIPAAVRVFSWGFPMAQGKGRIINARAETVSEKPMFRLPFVTHRCLVPARGFYEWSDAPNPARGFNQWSNAPAPARGFYEWSDAPTPASAIAPTSSIPPEPDMLQMAMEGFLPQALTKTEETGIARLAEMSGAGLTSKAHGKSPRIRHRFTRTDTRMLAMAGLYWTFRLSAMESLTAFTILTVGANADVSPIHDRMPLILEEGDLRTWLGTGISDAVTALLVPSVQGTLRRETLSAG